MRLNKYIADSGYCSRRKADKLVEDGQVTINGKKAELGDQVHPDDTVKIDNQLIEAGSKQKTYLAFNKPYGVISTLDKEADNSVLDYIDIAERVFYVGRLDVNSSGLMILTNDGDLAQKITNSAHGIEKEYVVTVDKKMTRSFIDKMRQGVMILGRKTKPARVKKVSETRFNIVITEGRNRQIRRMCEKLGYEVTKLRRIRIANIKLGTLGEGNTRQLTKTERRELLAL